MLKEMLNKAASGIERAAPQPQRPRHIKEIGEGASTALYCDAPAQPFIQRFLKRPFPCGVYAVTPECADTGRLLHQVEAALKGGVAAVQYREKTGNAALRYEQASALLLLCRQYAVPLIINDDIRLADRLDADGVHLGRDDGSLSEARRVLGAGKFIGASCYQTLQTALSAQAEGADYVAFGSFYPSPTKPNAKLATIALLQQATRVLRVPIVAIGGITGDNARPLIDAGARAIAVISALFSAENVEAAARRLNTLFIAETKT